MFEFPFLHFGHVCFLTNTSHNVAKDVYQFELQEMFVTEKHC